MSERDNGLPTEGNADSTPDAAVRTSEILDGAVCVCGYDLKVRGHCGTCGQYFSTCLGCHLPTRANRCHCRVKTRHPDHPEEWA